MYGFGVVGFNDFFMDMVEKELDKVTYAQTQIDGIKNVIYNDPATIVFWDDGTKTVVKCQVGEQFDKEKGLAMAILKKLYGGASYNEVFKKFVK